MRAGRLFRIRAKNRNFGGIPQKGHFWAFWAFWQNRPFLGFWGFPLFWGFWENGQFWENGDFWEKWVFGVDGVFRRRGENGDFWVFWKKCVFG